MSRSQVTQKKLTYPNELRLIVSNLIHTMLRRNIPRIQIKMKKKQQLQKKMRLDSIYSFHVSCVHHQIKNDLFEFYYL